MLLPSIFIFVGFVAICCFFALGETAFLSMDRQAATRSSRARRLKYILNELNYFLFAVRVGVLITWLSFGALSFAVFGLSWAFFAFTVGSALLALILSNVIKTRVVSTALTISAVFLYPLLFLLLFLAPISRAVLFLANGLMRRLGIDMESHAGISEADIRHLVNQSSAKGTIDAHEREMINNIFEFDDKSAQDIFVHRTDIVALDIKSDKNEIISTIANSEYSRFPVFQGSIDDIIGVLHIKDLLNHLLAGDARPNLDIASIIKPAHFVIASRKIDELFAEMSKTNVHMAIVVDEYGGCAGLFTMEDLLEEIVGQIYDEHDSTPAPDIEQISEGTFKIQGAAPFDQVARQLNIEPPPDEDFDTISGFLMHMLERVPNDGEKPQVTYGGYEFQVDKIEERRIYSVTATRCV